MEVEFKKLNFVIKKTEEILLAFNGVQRQDILTFCITMFQRLNSAANGVKVLLDKFNQNTTLEYSIGIVMRSVLLDLAITLNAIETLNLIDEEEQIFKAALEKSSETALEKNKKTEEFKKASIEKLELFCAKWLSDSLKYAINEVESFYAGVADKELKQLYSDIVKLAPERFQVYNNDGTKPLLKVSNDYTQRDLLRRLKNSKQISKSAEVFDAYSYYSKYDHFGQLFLGLHSMPAIVKLNMMSGSFKAFKNSLMFNLIILNSVLPNNSFLTNKVFEVNSFYSENP